MKPNAFIVVIITMGGDLCCAEIKKRKKERKKERNISQWAPGASRKILQEIEYWIKNIKDS